jgi:hypothetical protein
MQREDNQGKVRKAKADLAMKTFVPFQKRWQQPILKA